MSKSADPKVTIKRDLLRVLLAQHDMSQTDLAEESDLSPITITNIMNGKAFSSRTLGKIARALNVHPVDLIEAEGFADPLVEAPAITVQ